MLDSIKQRTQQISLADIGLWAVAALPALLGWLTGLTVKAILFIFAAFQEGYDRGRQ